MDLSLLMAAVSAKKAEAVTAMLCLTAITVALIATGRASDVMILTSIGAVAGLGGYQIGKVVPQIKLSRDSGGRNNDDSA